MSDLEQLEAFRETAWRELDAAERSIPDCEHVRAWRLRVDTARAGHRKAIKAAEAAQDAGRRPASMLQPFTFNDDGVEPAAEPDGQETLFELTPERAA